MVYSIRSKVIISLSTLSVAGNKLKARRENVSDSSCGHEDALQGCMRCDMKRAVATPSSDVQSIVSFATSPG